MSRSRKKNPTTADTPKGSWKHDYNSRIRTTSNQLLKQVIIGKIDPDELILPETDDVSDIWCSPKEQVSFAEKPKEELVFLTEFDKDWYEDSLERYEKSFRK